MIILGDKCIWVHPELLCCISDGDNTDELTVIEDLGWQVEHKMQSKEIVFKHDETDRYYLYVSYREGNDFKGWESVDYMDTTDSEGRVKCSEVVQEQVISYQWKEVK
ncbi:hypothetical protein SHANETTE_66 [Bacillus phage Shanette]|uniref:Uncharacterized protein n=1 Tax=Bacillus phage Shanette TaxID=1296656 RepID=S5M4Z8_9CAUD|nr:hypothetical protein AVV46_gp066 [Bacillus phage Shanette]AGR46966.1 hypothetical protein SHANETTE_66 [Bacillus phage Shanette]